MHFHVLAALILDDPADRADQAAFAEQIADKRDRRLIRDGLFESRILVENAFDRHTFTEGHDAAGIAQTLFKVDRDPVDSLVNRYGPIPQIADEIGRPHLLGFDDRPAPGVEFPRVALQAQPLDFPEHAPFGSARRNDVNL